MTADKEEKPLYLGHRERLRQRFMIDEGASMPDYELLELLLMLAIPRRDVKPLAKNLLAKYGNLQKLLQTPAHQLLDDFNLSETTLGAIRLVNTLAKRTISLSLSSTNEPVFTNWDAFEDYCRLSFAGKNTEEFHVYFLDSNYRLKGEKTLSIGTIDGAPVHPREIIRAAMEHNCVNIILAHNHPNGVALPSSDDIATTESICAAAQTMGIRVCDHLIITSGKIYSFRAHGRLPRSMGYDEY